MADQPFGLAWRAPLPHYQQAGIARLLAAPGVLLADEMGLGKTVQAIGAMRVLLRDGARDLAPGPAPEPGSALVVVPSGLVMQWRRQFREWAPELSLSTCTGPPEDRRGRWRTPAQVYLTSFDALRGDMALPAPLGPRHRLWAVVVADEAQRIKNAHTAIAATVKALPRRWACMSVAARDDAVADFASDPARRVMVASLRAAGVGLNLTAASVVFHFDRWWNPAVEAQAEDRAHRIGQARPVQVFAYLTPDSIEQWIGEILRDKRALFDDIIEGVATESLGRLGLQTLLQLVGRMA